MKKKEKEIMKWFFETKNRCKKNEKAFFRMIFDFIVNVVVI